MEEGSAAAYPEDVDYTNLDQPYNVMNTETNLASNRKRNKNKVIPFP